MKTIQCAHLPHHHNGFVATFQLWTASGGVHALLVLEPTMGALDCLHGVAIYMYIMLFVLYFLSTLGVMNQFLF